MKSLKQEHFYYGAILTAIMEYNPDTSMVLLQPKSRTRKIYKIQTNQSQECYVFFKHAFEKQIDSQSWQFQFSKNDKEFLHNCYKSKIPVFIYLLCAVKNLKESEIAVLRYEEFNEVSLKTNFTITKEKNSRNFELHRSKSSKDSITFSRSRIEKTFDDLINEEIKLSHGYYCPKCGTEVII